MKDAGVLSGDIAIIRRQEAVNDHQIAAVMVEGGATLKRVIKRGAEIVLRAANRHFKDIIVRADEATSLRVLGILTGVIRREVV
jgi:repressor LexA